MNRRWPKRNTLGPLPLLSLVRLGSSCVRFNTFPKEAQNTWLLTSPRSHSAFSISGNITRRQALLFLRHHVFAEALFVARVRNRPTTSCISGVILAARATLALSVVATQRALPWIGRNASVCDVHRHYGQRHEVSSGIQDAASRLMIYHSGPTSHVAGL